MPGFTDGELGLDGGRDRRRHLPGPLVRQIVDRDPCGLKRAANSYLCFRTRPGQALLHIPEASLR